MTETLSQRLRHAARGRVIIAVSLLALAVMVGLGIFVVGKSASRPSSDLRSTRLVDVISQTINSQGIDAGVAQYRSLRDRGFSNLPESFSDTNKLGYQFLGKGENQAAIQIFQLNVETHPKSSSAYDSLGEAYAAAGNKELAIENYRKALAFNPENTNSKAALLRLTGRPATPYSPLLWVHIAGGTVGLLSGFLALVLRKGSQRHRVVGRVFAVSMMCMAGAAAWLASGRYAHSLLCGNSLDHGQTSGWRNQQV
jgi:tetratricopeptide (TPR) repeat protein